MLSTWHVGGTHKGFRGGTSLWNGSEGVIGVGGHLYEGREDRVWLVGPGPRRVYGQGAQSREAPKAS